MTDPLELIARARGIAEGRADVNGSIHRTVAKRDHVNRRIAWEAAGRPQDQAAALQAEWLALRDAEAKAARARQMIGGAA